MLAMDEVYQVLVDVAMDKAIVHLELAAEMLHPEVTAEVIWKEDDLSAQEFFHHLVCQIIAATDCKPINIGIGQRTKQGGLFFLNDGSLPAPIQMFTKKHARVNIIVEGIPRIEVVDKCVFMEHSPILCTVVDDITPDYHPLAVDTRQHSTIMPFHHFRYRSQTIAHNKLVNDAEHLRIIAYHLIKIVGQ